MTAKAPRRRRLWRWLRRGVAGLIATVAVLAAALMIALQTDCGQEVVRSQVEKAAARSFAGKVEVGRARIHIGGTLRLGDLAVAYPDGTPALAVESIEISCDLLPLLRGKVRCTRLELAGVNAAWRPEAGPLLVPQEEKSDLALEIAAITLSGARLDLGPGRIVSGIGLDAALEMNGDSIAVTVEKLAGRWEAEARDISASGKIVLEGEVVTSSTLAVKTGASRMAIDLRRWDLGSGEVEAQLAADFAAADVPIEGWRSAIAADLTVGGRIGERVAVAGKIGAGGGTATIDAAMSDRLAGTVHLAGIDPSRIHEDAPAGTIDLEATFDVAVSSLAEGLAALEGRLRLAVGGSIAGEDLGAIEIEARAGDGRFSAAIEASSPRGHGSLEAAATLEDGAWRIEQARASGEVANLAALVTGLAARSATVELRASGPIDALATRGEATVIAPRLAEWRADAVRGSIAIEALSLLDPLASSAGGFDLEARGVRSPSIAVGRIAAAGRFADRGGGVSTKASARISIEKLDRLERAGATARIEHSAERTEIRLENLELVVAGGLTWRGRARSIEIRGAQTQVRGLALSSAAGRLEADADLGPGGERVELAIRGLDLAQARALHQLPLRGQLEADLSAARRRGRFEGELTASVRKLSAPGLPPVDTQLEASLAGRRLAAKGSLDPVTGGGAARFDIALDVPTDPTDPAAWLRLGLADVSRLAVDLEQVDARQIERFAGIAIEGDGVASASLRVPDDGAHRLGIRAKVSGGRAGLVRHLGATIEGHWDGAGLRGDASLEHAGELVASATLSLATGIETLWRDPAALSRASADAQVTLNGFRLARLVAAKLIATPIAGFLTATIRASGTLEKPRLRVEQGVVSRLEIDKMRLRSLELSGTYEGGRGEANVVATPRTGGAIRAAIEGDVERRALRATLSGRAIQLEGLRPLAPDADHPLASLAGKLDLIRVVIDVSPERLAASGQIAVREGSIVVEDGARKIEGIGAEIALRGDRVRLLGVRAKSGGGSLAASGSVRFAGYQPTELELDVIADDVPYVAGSWAASIDLASRITGRFRAGRWIVEAPVHRGEVTLRDTGRELQDIAALEDVVFVDRKSRRARAAGDSPLRARLNINLGKGIEIRSKDIDAILVGSLTADVDGAAPVRLSGELRTRRGTFRFFDLDYNIVRAVATFDGRVPTDPDLDIEITRRFRQATVAVQVHGKLSRVLGDSRGEHVTLSSDSGYTQEQVLALMLGQDPDDDSQSGGGDIGGVGRAVVAGEVRGALRSVGIRIDVVKFHQDGWEVGKWFRLKLGSFIDRRILIGARVRDTEEPRKNASEGTVEIPLTDSLNLEGRVGDRTIGNIDLLWIKRF